MSWQRPNIGSRVNREIHARFWERVEVKFLRATRQKQTWQLLRLYVDLLLNNNRKCERKCGALAGL